MRTTAFYAIPKNLNYGRSICRTGTLCCFSCFDSVKTVDGPAHGTVIPGTVIPGDHDAGTHGYPVEKADHEKDQITGGADCCKRIVVDKISDAPGVECIIKLLKHIAQKYRKGEKQHGFPDRPLGQAALMVQDRTLLSKSFSHIIRSETPKVKPSDNRKIPRHKPGDRVMYAIVSGTSFPVRSEHRLLQLAQVRVVANSRHYTPI